MPTPTPRHHRSFWGDTSPHTGEEGTWMEAEALTYPSGGFHRRAYVVLSPNPFNPIALPYGEKRVVRCSVPDTYFSVPARLRYRGRTVSGFVTVEEPGTYTFTPDGDKGWMGREGGG